ncbi:DUF4132 domain-containing protein [Corynebacterium cystitidis]|uniref:DUF4132 domain-containing protein n=1 Tax=Corynebacterium cystitidis DSM 20524 TaxID=1121357 RepID=A0A1H9PT06_9CORY|nr:DUF4132 domain-containing protein [Corynebacterium cystitidis]WJY82392.1 hypothetical protein CCYS_07340 [Corynebacterium cystitidis DSM 20524]SER51357.1 protein of unknown function [Corynebacterium cystitidis DSM 20524]SNV76011.1 Uncharacterised protein [Corynebacterium cystitidis]
MTSNADTAISSWFEGADYDFALSGAYADKIVARNKKGRTLKSVPKKAKTDEVYQQVDALRNYFAAHHDRCREAVIAWLFQEGPVPSEVLGAIWKDSVWQHYVKDLVVTAGGVHGLLRHADATCLQLVDLDGESHEVEVSASQLVQIPHPIKIAQRDQWREFVIDLGVTQSVDQLFRDVYPLPETLREREDAMQAYADAEINPGGILAGIARDNGAKFSTQYLQVEVEEQGRRVQGRLDISFVSPKEKAFLSSVYFTAADRSVPPSDIGPVTWSETMRLAHQAYAARTIDNTTEEAHS